jgi:hypothetical protein
MLEAILVGIIDAFLLRKTMQFCSGVDMYEMLADRPLSLSKRGMCFHVSGGKQKGGARHGMSAVACTFVPSSKSPELLYL